MSAPDPDNAGAGLGPLAGPEPTLREDRVDLTLVRWMLSLTPAEPLQVLQQNVRSILRLGGDETET
jgi:hypothetical protein